MIALECLAKGYFQGGNISDGEPNISICGESLWIMWKSHYALLFFVIPTCYLQIWLLAWKPGIVNLSENPLNTVLFI